jgi:hypothetical protein
VTTTWLIATVAWLTLVAVGLSLARTRIARFVAKRMQPRKPDVKDIARLCILVSLILIALAAMAVAIALIPNAVPLTLIVGLIVVFVISAAAFGAASRIWKTP